MPRKLPTSLPTTGVSIDAGNLPRVSASVSVAALKEEYKFRGHGTKGLSSLKKSDLLLQLVDDTILITGTAEYKALMRIKAMVEEEMPEKRAAAGSIVEQRRKDEEQRAVERARKAEERAAKEQKRAEEEREKEIQAFILETAPLHRTLKPAVHKCKMAETADVSGGPFSGGVSRVAIAICSLNEVVCEQRPCVLSCVKCDFDACGRCVELLEMSPAKRKKKEEEVRREKERKRKLALKRAREEEEQREAKRRREMEAWEKRMREEEEEREKAMKKLANPPAKIGKPPKANKDGNKLLAFVVRKSLGYPPDGFHSYAGPPEKEFDSSYASKKDANERARYLFYRENAWGLGVGEMFEGEVTEKECSGLASLEFVAGDSEVWAVEVVPKAVCKRVRNGRASWYDDDAGYNDDDDDDDEGMGGRWTGGFAVGF